MLINESIWISQKPESIWDYWMDVANDVNWRDGIIKARWTSLPPYGIGSNGEHTHEKMGILYWEVTRFEEGRSFEFIHTDGGLKGSVAIFQVEPEANGSLVQVKMKVIGPILMRVMMFLMSGIVRKGVQGDLQKLKVIMEKPADNVEILLSREQD